MLIRVKRPIIWITFAYVMGILAGIAVNKKLMALLWGTALLVVLAAWFMEYRREANFILILVAIGLLGAAAIQRYLNIKNPLDDVVGRTVTVKGQIADSPGIWRNGMFMY